MTEYPEYNTCPHCGSAIIRPTPKSLIVDDGKLDKLDIEIKSGANYGWSFIPDPDSRAYLSGMLFLSENVLDIIRNQPHHPNENRDR